MSRFVLAVLIAGFASSLALSSEAFAQQCGGGQGPSPSGGGRQFGTAAQGPMQTGLGGQDASQTSPQQQMALVGAQLAGPQQACSQIAAYRRQERIQQVAYRAMMAEQNRERFAKVAEAEQKRRDALRERNRLRSLEQDAERQLEEVATLTVER